jgi:hypothetical protein
MDSSKIVSIAAIAISIVSISALVGINSILQSNVGKLENDLHKQSEISKSLDSDLNSTHFLLESQRVKIEELGSNITMIREADRSGLLELQHEITNIQANITSMKNNTESLMKRVVSLEEKIITSAALVPNQLKFEPITLSDENNKNWTSHYIKEKLYDARINSWCNSNFPNCYVHLSKLNSLVGTAIAIDTIGSSDSGYYFMGYSNKYVVPADGLVKVSGKFLKKDNLVLAGLGKNSTLSVFILGENPDLIINKTTLFGDNDTNDVWFSKEIEFKLNPGEIFRIGFGGTDSWIQDYKQYDSWAGVSVRAEPKS